jgi:hypothetical protein
MSKFSEVKDLVQDAIEKGATSVEEVHQKIASMPFEVLEQIAPDIPAVKSISQVQQKTIGSVYEAIRAFNKAVGEAAERILKTVEKDKPA